MRIARIPWTLSSVVCLTFILSLSPVRASDDLQVSPFYQRWQLMEKEIQKLKGLLPAGREPESSRDAMERSDIMKRIIVIYNEAAGMFSSGEIFTDYPERERQWYAHMRRTCRIYSDAWRKQATSMEERAVRLRGEGK